MKALAPTEALRQGDRAMEEIRAIVTDLDGTLLRADGSVSPYTARVLNRAHQAGFDVFFATARPKASAIRITQQIIPTAPVICSNGAMIYDPVDGHTHRTIVMRTDTVRKIVSHVRHDYPQAVMAVDRTSSGARESMRAIDPDWPAKWGNMMADRCLWRMDDFLPPPSSVLCLLVLGAWQKVEDVPRRWSATVTSSENDLIEFSAPSANKESALKWLCSRRNIDIDTVVAFGDMPNDLGMLGACGISVAVANAHKRVLTAADFLTDTNDEDGVARFLSDLLATQHTPALS